MQPRDLNWAQSACDS